MSVYQILVIILAIFLAVFLVLAIVSTILAIKILKRADKLTNQAADVVGNLESVSTTIKNVANPAAVLRFLYNSLKSSKRNNHKN